MRLHAVALLYVRQYGTYSAFRGVGESPPLASQDRLGLFHCVKYHFVAALPTLLVLFSQKSTEIHDTMKNLLIDGVVRVVILYCSAFVHIRFFGAKRFKMTGNMFL